MLRIKSFRRSWPLMILRLLNVMPSSAISICGEVGTSVKLQCLCSMSWILKRVISYKPHSTYKGFVAHRNRQKLLSSDVFID